MPQTDVKPVRLTAAPPEKPAELKAYLEGLIKKGDTAGPPPLPYGVKQGSGWAGLKDALADAGDMVGGVVSKMTGLKAGFQPVTSGPPGKPLTVAQPFFSGGSPDEMLANVGIPGMPEGFISKLDEALASTKQGLFESEQLKGFLKGKNVTDEEIKWSGLKGLLDSQKKVSRADIEGVLASRPGVRERVLKEIPDESYKYDEALNAAGQAMEKRQNELMFAHGFDQGEWPAEAHDEMSNLHRAWRDAETARDNYVQNDYPKSMPQYDRDSLKLPGPSSNYREILLKHEPVMYAQITAAKQASQEAQTAADTAYKEWHDAHIAAHNAHGPWLSDWPQDVRDQEKVLRAHYEDLNLKHNEAATLLDKLENGQTFNSSHYDDSNILSHMRLSDRATPTGEKVSLAEEHQSDWAKAHRKAVGAATKTGTTPPAEPAPFVGGDWVNLNVKRHLLEAARDPETKWVGWTTGEQQVQRYEQALRSVADDIRFTPGKFGGHTHLDPISGQPTGGAKFKMFKKGERVYLPSGVKEPENWQEVEGLLGPELTEKLKANTPGAATTRAKFIAAPQNSRYPGATWHVLDENGDLVTEFSGSTAERQARSYAAQAQNYAERRSAIPEGTHRIQADAGDFRLTAKWPYKLYDEHARNLYQDLTKERAVKLPVEGQNPDLHQRFLDEIGLGRDPNPPADSTQSVWAIPLTPKARARILKGLPLYSSIPLLLNHKQTRQPASPTSVGEIPPRP